MIQVPRDFYLMQGFELPHEGQFGTGMVFLPQDPAESRKCEEILIQIAADEGVDFLSFRDVPRDNSTIGDIARKVGGHGGMDFIMDYRLIYCMKNGLPLDQDVYDAAAWSAVVPLSIDSVADKSNSRDVPDFTRGAWESNRPLAIVDVDPSLLPLRALVEAGEQLDVR